MWCKGKFIVIYAYAFLRKFIKIILNMTCTMSFFRIHGLKKNTAHSNL